MSYPQPQQQTWQTGEPPLWAPYYGAPFPAAVKRFWKKYTVFTGRASRSEYWWWVLVSASIGIVLQVIATVAGGAGATTTASGSVSGPAYFPVLILLIVWGLATFIPSLALTVRRLHDGNFSGWLVLLALVPFLGGIALLIMTILPSNPAGQRFDQPGA